MDKRPNTQEPIGLPRASSTLNTPIRRPGCLQLEGDVTEIVSASILVDRA
jgi:hypothetical protein